MTELKTANNDWVKRLTPRYIERFHALYEKSESGCWNWIGTISNQGYGVLSIGHYVRAHRLSYFLHTGHIPDCIDHLCRNRKCVNPDHLEAVTKTTNLLRGVGSPAINSRKTKCKRGHDLSGENLYVRIERDTGKKSRVCRECKKIVSTKCQKIRRMKKRIAARKSEESSSGGRK